MKQAALNYRIASIVLFGSLPIPSALAGSYSGALTSNRSWTDSIWTPTGPPGASDDILDISSTATYALTVNGSFNILSLGKTSGGTARLINRGGYNDSLTINGTLAINNGTYGIRGIQTSESGGLTITTKSLTLGKADSIGVLQIGDTSDNQYVTFTVQERTTLTGNAAGGGIQIGATSVANAKTYVDLGHVVYSNVTTSTGTFGIAITQPGTELRIASLRTEGTVYTSASLRGAGIVNLYGNADDPHQPEESNRFESNITGDLKIKKTGSNQQIFARTAGNNYTGGTEISGGILAISNERNNITALGTGAVVVMANGTLAASGSGTVRLTTDQSITVKSGGSIAAGALGEPGFAQLRFNGSDNGTAAILIMEEGASFTFRLGVGGQSDTIALLGYQGASDLILNNTQVNLTGPISAGIYNLFYFKSNESAASSVEALSSVSSGLTGGLTVGSGFEGFNGIFHYDDPAYGGVGTISLELVAVPEPGSIALMGGLAVFGLGYAFRRRF